MISVSEASILVRTHLPKWNCGTPLVTADRDYPPFNRAMMDGIAVRFSDFEQGMRSFKIQGICPAGEAQKELTSGCMEIMTGAPMPTGSDLNIQYEHLKIENGHAVLTTEVKRTRFSCVHLAGSDCKKGDMVLGSGLLPNGPRVGIIASMGESIKQFSPRIMIISTGDELVERDPMPHQVRRSNVHALKSSLEINGFHDITLDHLEDNPKQIAAHFSEATKKFDLLIYSGGVSKGKFDYLPNVWADLGVTKYFHEVAQKPGKPMWFGADKVHNTVIVGLPGNPVSSLVCLHRYLLPSRELSVKLTEEITIHNKLTNFIPVSVSSKDGMLIACPLKIQNSGEFTALANSDGFIEYSGPASSYSFYPWRNF